MLSNEVIGAIRALLARVQISGAEVPAFNTIMAALAVAEAANRPRTAPELVRPEVASAVRE